jgi:hypothetical protein
MARAGASSLARLLLLNPRIVLTRNSWHHLSQAPGHPLVPNSLLPRTAHVARNVSRRSASEYARRPWDIGVGVGGPIRERPGTRRRSRMGSRQARPSVSSCCCTLANGTATPCAVASEGVLRTERADSGFDDAIRTGGKGKIKAWIYFRLSLRNPTRMRRPPAARSCRCLSNRAPSFKKSWHRPACARLSPGRRWSASGGQPRRAVKIFCGSSAFGPRGPRRTAEVTANATRGFFDGSLAASRASALA